MATYDLEEQEQIDELKTWWRMYGNLVTGVLLAVAVVLAGWQGWNWWQRRQSAEASLIYTAMQQAAAANDVKRTRELAGELIDKYSGTAYAGLGAMVSARAQADGGDAKTARAQLGWAAENAKEDALRDLARLRLAALLADEKAYDDALKQLAAEPGATLAPRYAELKGDVMAVQGKAAEARAAYEAALAKLDALPREQQAMHGAYRDILKAKHESLGGAK